METVLFEDTFIGHIIGFILKGILLLCIVGLFVIVIRWIIKGIISFFSKKSPEEKKREKRMKEYLDEFYPRAPDDNLPTDNGWEKPWQRRG